MAKLETRRLVRRARNLFAYLAVKYSISLAELDEFVGRLEDWVKDVEAPTGHAKR